MLRGLFLVGVVVAGTAAFMLGERGLRGRTVDPMSSPVYMVDWDECRFFNDSDDDGRTYRAELKKKVDTGYVVRIVRRGDSNFDDLFYEEERLDHDRLRAKNIHDYRRYKGLRCRKVNSYKFSPLWFGAPEKI